MALVVALVVVALIQSSGIAAAVTPLAQADVAGFSSRAEAWTEARRALQDEALDQAAALAEAARAEQEREEAEAATTTAPPTTTAAPTTTRAPATTQAPTTTRAPTTTAPPTTQAPTPTAAPATTAPAPGGPSPAQWEVLRQCESSGNYGAVSANGRYRGAYQFSQATWDWVASGTDPALVGIDPAAATPAQQDAVARGLWERRGWAPWPICGDLAAAA